MSDFYALFREEQCFTEKTFYHFSVTLSHDQYTQFLKDIFLLDNVQEFLSQQCLDLAYPSVRIRTLIGRDIYAIEALTEVGLLVHVSICTNENMYAIYGLLNKHATKIYPEIFNICKKYGKNAEMNTLREKLAQMQLKN